MKKWKYREAEQSVLGNTANQERSEALSDVLPHNPQAVTPPSWGLSRERLWERKTMNSTIRGVGNAFSETMATEVNLNP